MGIEYLEINWLLYNKDRLFWFVMIFIYKKVKYLE